MGFQEVHLGRDFPCAVHLLLLGQPGDRRPAGVVWVNVAGATTKNGKLGTGNAEWASHSLRRATHSKARQGWNRVELAKMYVAIEGMGCYFTR